MVRCLWFFGSLFDDSSGSFHYCDHPYSGAVLPVQRSYINARERLRLRWTKKETSKKKKKKTQQKENIPLGDLKYKEPSLFILLTAAGRKLSNYSPYH